MDLGQLGNFFSGESIFRLFFKTFAVVFSVLYIIYALVIYKQTQIMTKTLITNNGTLIRFISLLQIFIGVGLLIFSLIINWQLYVEV